MCFIPRPGTRPFTSTIGPQTQLTQQSSPDFWGRLVADVFAIPDVIEGHSQVSPASSRAVFLIDQEKHRIQETSLFPGGRLEPVHIHGVHDTSLHVTLPQLRGETLTDLGWAEPHQYADFGTEFMIYGPRDEDELHIVLAIVKESLAFARGTSQK